MNERRLNKFKINKSINKKNIKSINKNNTNTISKNNNSTCDGQTIYIPPKLPLSLRMEHFLSKPIFRKVLDGTVIAFFILVIIGPVINIFSMIFLNIPSIYSDIFNDKLMGNLQWNLILKALRNSFSIAAIAIVIDIIISIPAAIILTRYNFKGMKLLDTILDLPMAVPTSALGLSVMLFWMTFGIEPGYTLIILAHIVFTFPYILRNMKIVMEKTATIYEDAARTLGAPGFTVFRTVTLPLMKEGLIAGAILSFTRSLGETGATIIVAGLIQTAPIMIVGLRRQLELPSASFLAGILIVISLILLFSIKFISRNVGFPIKRVFPKFESMLSTKFLRIIRNAFTLICIFFLILVPALFIFTQVSSEMKEELFGPDLKWAYLFISFMNSLKIGIIAVFIDLIFGIPFALIITRRKWGKIINLLDTILDIPIVIPSAALGFAVFMFWGPQQLNLFSPGFSMILFVHVTFTFPYMVRPIIGVLEAWDAGVEEAARTLGAPKLTVFRKITFPNIKQGVIAGAIMVFTRSLGETGATIVVMGSVRTIPVLIVDWVEANSYGSAIFASICIMIFSAILLLLLRYMTKQKEKQGGKS
ncbi:MAG: ABC transporter permease [Promethearchaeota archaeon]